MKTKYGLVWNHWGPQIKGEFTLACKYISLGLQRMFSVKTGDKVETGKKKSFWWNKDEGGDLWMLGDRCKAPPIYSDSLKSPTSRGGAEKLLINNWKDIRSKATLLLGGGSSGP